MALGRKSIVRKLEIPNNKDQKKLHVVLIQANKNYGICDVLLVTEPGKKIRMAETLSTFQGKQFNDLDVVEHLWNVLNETLNPTED